MARCSRLWIAAVVVGLCLGRCDNASAQSTPREGAPGTTVSRSPARRQNTPPVADAGADQTVAVASAVRLDGSRSTDADGDRLAFSWSLIRRPALSQATVSSDADVMPTFVADVPGAYVARLVTHDGVAFSRTATVTIDTRNSAPVANAGSDRTVAVGDVSRLTAAGSSDVDGDALAYAWTLQSAPRGSRAVLLNSSDAITGLLLDRPGRYVVRLVAFDGRQRSVPAFMTIHTRNSAPVADAGRRQTARAGATVQLDGSGSTDVDGDRLSYAWALTTRPAGSTARLSDASAVTPTFDLDQPGAYVAQLVVSDSGGETRAATVAITTSNAPPTAAAGPAHTVAVGQVAVLDGSASSDADADPLSYRWALVSRPANSRATLSDARAAMPTFIVDQPGTYVAQLIVNDGVADSAPSLTTIHPLASLPVAVARLDPTSGPGPTIHLDGSQSFDPDGSPLTYAWSLLSTPLGSAATLSNPLAVDPTFTIDQPGAYVAQLIVNDGTGDSAPVSLLVNLSTASPLVNAGPDQEADIGDTVQLDGSRSSAPFFLWSFASTPGGSTAAIANATSVAPTFVVDLPGDYVVQLVVSDGVTTSLPDTMTVSTSARGLSLSPSGLSLVPGGGGTLTVSMAGSPGALFPMITLTSSNPAVASVPTQVTIPVGQTSAVIPVTAGTSGAAIITATVAGHSARAVVAVGGRLVEWIVDTSGSWDDPTKWSINAVPAAGDVVVIDRPAAGVVVTVPSTTAAVQALYSIEAMVVNGTLVVAGEALLARGLMLSGALSGTGKVTLAAPMTWSSGGVSLAGGLEVLPGQTLTMATGNGHVLSAGPLTNHGTVVWQAGEFYIQGTIDVLNASDGVWEAQADLNLTSSSCGSPTFTNAGLLRKTAGTGQLTVASCVAMTNTGTLELQTGSMAFGGTLVTSGLLTAGAGTAFYLQAVTLQTGSTFSGTGLLHMNGTTTVTGNLTTTLPVVQTGAVTGSGKLTLAAPMTWTSGVVSLAGGLEVLSGQTLTMATGNGHVLSAGPLTNHGTVVWQAGEFYVQGTIDVLNAFDGVWEVQGNLNLTSSLCGAPTFTNAGLLRKTGVTGSLSVTNCVSLSNTGTIQVRLGGTALGQYDRIAAGSITLGGTLDVILTNGFTPSSGNTFDVVTYGARVSTFAVVNGNGETYTATYGATALTLQKP